MTKEECIEIPYGKKKLTFNIPGDRLSFVGQMEPIPPIANFAAELEDSLDHPIGCKPLAELLQHKEAVLILVEDGTRNTPVARILSVLLPYIEQRVKRDNITIMTAPGTHRIMTADEINDKLGRGVVENYHIIQHDYLDESSLRDLGKVRAGEKEIPIEVNRHALEADFIIGLGSIVPHSDAGYSGGGKIVAPGICGYSTTAATHIAAALLEEIPLGRLDNPCRQGIERVAEKVGLDFIVNLVNNSNNEVAGIYAGDFIKAHRRGAEKSRQAYGVNIDTPAEIVVVSSFPFDLDWWQADKSLISASLAVKKRGIIVFLAPCPEGLESNHPGLCKWLPKSYHQACRTARESSLLHKDLDLIAADLAITNAKIRERADIFIVTEGLTHQEIEVLGYRPFNSLQKAVDCALKIKPAGKVGVLPRGGDCLPVAGSV